MRRMTDDLRAQLKQAYALIKAGDNAAAAALLKPICRANPENVDAWWLLSFALTDENHIRLALEQILKVNPQHEQARQRLEKLTPRQETAAEARPPISRFNRLLVFRFPYPQGFTLAACQSPLSGLKASPSTRSYVLEVIVVINVRLQNPRVSIKPAASTFRPG